MSSVTTSSPPPSGLNLFARLRAVKFGDDVQDPLRFRMKTQILSNLIQNLVMLLENGLSLPKAIATLVAEPSFRKYAWMLNGIKRKLETGESFSHALAGYPRTFSRLIVSQIRVGERSGTMTDTLRRISTQFERSGEVKKRIAKRLSYPAMILMAGTGLIIFMMTVVVPEFESVFEESGADLPLITQAVSVTSRFLFSWGWLVAVTSVVLFLLFARLRRHPPFAEFTDRLALRIPIVGTWLRDYAVLQFIDTAGIMMDSGFVPVEAIHASVDGVNNHAVRKVIGQITSAVRRGQKLSDELARHPEMFPPTISQLVVVGEQTGNLSSATQGVRAHLRLQLESRIDSAVSMIEPVLTLLMAALIGCVVMAIYMPMFGMLEAME